MSLPEALENAADALPSAADAIRDANGDADALLERVGESVATEIAAWMLVHEPDAAALLLGDWMDSESGTRAIAAIDADALPKAGRKLLRRTLHALRSSGVELPAAPAPVPRVVRLPELEEAVSGAFALPLDPRGARVVLLIEAQPDHQSKIYEAVIDDVRGIVDFAAYEARRSRVRAFIKQLARRTGGGALPIEPGEARALIVRAAARQSSERPAPRAFVDHRSRLGLDAAGDQTPGDRVRALLGDEEPTRERLESLSGMVRAGAIGPWPPAFDRLRTLADGFKEQVEGRVIVSGATQRERIDGALADCATEIYDEAFSAITAERFRETAFVYWSTGREDEARACLAGARAFETLPVAENTLALTIVEALLGPAVSAMAADDAAAGLEDASPEAGGEDTPRIIEG